jgi:hypothetical protein
VGYGQAVRCLNCLIHAVMMLLLLLLLLPPPMTIIMITWCRDGDKKYEQQVQDAVSSCVYKLLQTSYRAPPAPLLLRSQHSAHQCCCIRCDPQVSRCRGCHSHPKPREEDGRCRRRRGCAAEKHVRYTTATTSSSFLLLSQLSSSSPLHIRCDGAVQHRFSCIEARLARCPPQ